MCVREREREKFYWTNRRRVLFNEKKEWKGDFPAFFKLVSFVNKKSRSRFSRTEFASTPQVKPKQFWLATCRRCLSVSSHQFVSLSHTDTLNFRACVEGHQVRAYRAFTLGSSSSSSSSASLSATQFHVLNLDFAVHIKKNDKHVRNDDWGKGLEGRVLTPLLPYSLPRLPPLQGGKRETGNCSRSLLTL